MGDKSRIEWTEATWNPVVGCDKVSPGCDNCYAESLAERFAGTPQYPDGFEVRTWPTRLDIPVRWTRPRRIFVCSMADLFHDRVDDGYVAQVFAAMARAPWHTFQVLTKRHGRMRSLLNSPLFWEAVRIRAGLSRTEFLWPLPHVWVGVSAENQQWADIRIRALLETPAAVRWVSAEPLLGPIDLLGDEEQPGPAILREGVRNRTDYGTGVEYDYDDQVAIDWVVTGGESGREARPMHPDWALAIQEQCEAAGIAYLHKQNGEYVPVDEPRPGDVWLLSENQSTQPWTPDSEGAPAGRWSPFEDVLLRRVGKKAAGRELRGRVFDGYPEAAGGPFSDGEYAETLRVAHPGAH